MPPQGSFLKRNPGFLLAVGLLAALPFVLALLNGELMVKPIVSPEIASLGFTVEGLLMLLIGGIGTLSGAMVGAAVLRLMDFYLARWFGESAGFVIGAVYVMIVMFLPYGIVGTWRLRRLDIKAGWQRLLELLQLNKPTPGDAGRQ